MPVSAKANYTRTQRAPTHVACLIRVAAPRPFSANCRAGDSTGNTSVAVCRSPECTQRRRLEWDVGCCKGLGRRALLRNVALEFHAKRARRGKDLFLARPKQARGLLKPREDSVLFVPLYLSSCSFSSYAFTRADHSRHVHGDSAMVNSHATLNRRWQRWLLRYLARATRTKRVSSWNRSRR